MPRLLGRTPKNNALPFKSSATGEKELSLKGYRKNPVEKVDYQLINTACLHVKSVLLYAAPCTCKTVNRSFLFLVQELKCSHHDLLKRRQSV